MAVREDIKVLLARKCVTLTELAKMLSEKTNKKVTVYSLSKKLLKSTMKYDEAKEIADCLGYELNFKEK